MTPDAESSSIDLSDHTTDRWIGCSPPMRALAQSAKRAAPRRSTVLITGETGSGKEMLARFVHTWSDRASNAFIPVDCSTLSETLFESELFGHVRGAFTGAMRDTLGFIRCGDGGTVFLDEIGELPLSMQAKLLRVLQERLVTPVGSSKRYPVNVRFVAATNRSLLDMVDAGTFRADLFYRLNVVSLHVPPLRRRPQDIIPLVEYFIDQQARLYDERPCMLSPEASEALCNWHWPGNVRELSNTIEQVHILASGRMVTIDDLPPHFRQVSPSAPVVIEPADTSLFLEEIERNTITQALERTGHCKAAASRLLGINVQRLNRRIHRLGILMR
ncbi:MAG: sigma 54-interacting transcriptional regulator [Phycisphaerales bacterium]|nr:sigma 54-interacting transcriptional regulator [Phycisphaerales bacterium]